MKQLLIKILIVASIGFLYGIPAAATSAEDVPVILTYTENDTTEDEVDIPSTPPSKHHRMPPPPMYGLLSKTNGVQITGVDTTLIRSFEIYDANGIPLAIVADEPSFIEILFSLKGEMQIVFRLDDRNLSGWIEL